LQAGLRRAVRQAIRIDRGGFTPLAGTRVGLGVVVALVLGRIFRNPAAEASLAAGALLAGIPAAINSGRMSLRALGVVSFSMALSTFVGSSSGELGWVHTAVLAVWCLVAGLLMGLDSPATPIGTQGVAAMIVFGRFSEPPGAALHLALYVFAGGLIATLVVAVSRPPVTSAVQRRSIAAAFASLAELAGTGVTHRNGVASAKALETAEELLQKGLHVNEEEARQLRAIVDVARRSRLEVLAIEGLGRRLIRLGADPAASPWAAVDNALSVVANAFAALGAGLTAAKADGGAVADASTEATQRARRVLEAAAGEGRHDPVGSGATTTAPTTAAGDGRRSTAAFEALEAHLSALAGQLRAGAELVARATTSTRHWSLRTVGRRPARDSVVAGLREDWDALRAHASLGSPVGRHALRLAIVVTGAEVLAVHTPIGRGYWVALTASVVLRPDFSVTFSRGLARMLGTCVGVVLAGLLAVAVHANTAAEIAVIGLLAVAVGGTFNASYAVFTGFLTGLVVLLVGVVSPGTFSTAVDRLEDTLLGGALALAVYGLWPTWSEQQAPQALASLVGRQREYLGVVLSVAGGARAFDGHELRRLARAARQAKAEADDAMARAADEPEDRRFSSAKGSGILVALSRISLAAHALRSDIEDHRIGAPAPALAPFARDVSDALRRVGDQLTHPAASGLGPRPPLRRRYEELSEEMEGQGGSGPLLTTCDELVDAVNTLADLLERTHSPPLPDAS
jgi:uncharacterized membrane protein YccC